MKLLIKKLVRENLLTEKLMEIDDDVNMIFDKFFKKDVIEVERTGIVNNGMFLSNETNTSILQNEKCKEAHVLNPCVIYINQNTNFYNPSRKIISLSANFSAIDFIKDVGGDFAKAIEWVGDRGKILSRELTEERIKGSIHHELTHWIDDTMNKGHIKKKVNKPNYHPEKSTAEKFEIQAQIHNIKQLKNKFYKIWDELSFSDMIEYSPSLYSVYINLKDDVKNKWVKDIKIRMHREGLLGKNMVNTK
jgi:hypothetical protein